MKEIEVSHADYWFWWCPWCGTLCNQRKTDESTTWTLPGLVAWNSKFD